MKRNIALSATALAALALALASCQKSPVQGELAQSKPAVGFRALGQSGLLKGAAADDVTSVAALEKAGFHVAVYKGSDGSLFIADSEATKNPGYGPQDNWGTGTTYYWPEENLDVVAVSSYDKLTAEYGFTTKSFGTAALGDNSFTYTTPADITKQIDVVIAANSEANRTAHEGPGIPLAFQHIFAQVDVQVGNGIGKTLNNAPVMKIAGVALVNLIKDGGEFNFPANTQEGKEWVAGQPQTTLEKTTIWPNMGTTRATFQAFAGADGGSTLELLPDETEYEDAVQATQNFFVLPQLLTEWKAPKEKLEDTADLSTTNTGFRISFLSQITSADRLTRYFPKPSRTDVDYDWISVAVPSDVLDKFAPGIKYVFRVNFNSDGNGNFGYEDPIPGDIPGGEHNPGNTPDPTPGTDGDDDEGDPIKTPAPITFNPSVDQFFTHYVTIEGQKVYFIDINL